MCTVLGSVIKVIVISTFIHTRLVQEHAGRNQQQLMCLRILSPLYLQDYVGQVLRLRSCAVNAPGDQGNNRTMGG